MENPLLDLHRQAQAELQNYGELQIVSTFGEPQAEYAAIRKSVGMMDLPQRGFLELTGRDRLQFLNNLLTAQTWDKQSRQPMSVGQWVYSFLLNLKGRVVADMNVLELDDRTVVETDRRLAQPLKMLLEAYLFGEQVKITDRSEDLHEIALFGPGIDDVRRAVATDARPWSPAATGTCAMIRILEHDILAWHDDPTGTPGINLALPAGAARSVWMQLITTLGQSSHAGKRRLRPVGWAAFNAARIEAGRPLFGIDFDGAPIASALPSKLQRDANAPDAASPGMLPAETGLMERAVSLSKCYIGQEIVARMHARGQVARKIVGIRMEDDALPIAGSEILDKDSNPIGVVTSSTNSPVLSNLAIALGVVKRPFFEPDTALRIPAEGALRAGTVTHMPFLPLATIPGKD